MECRRHCHIVVKFTNIPVDTEGKVQFIDDYISAKTPAPIDENTTVNEKRYCSYVQKRMIHNCAVAVNGCKKIVQYFRM